MLPSAHTVRLRRAAAALLGCVAGGLALAAAFTWPSLRHLAFVAPVPWILVATGGGRAFTAIAWPLVGVATYFAACHAWLWSSYGAVAFVVTVSWCVLHVVPVPLAWRWLMPRLPRAWALVHVPAAWVAFEWLRARNPVGRPGMYLVGYSQADDLAFVQSADTWGAWGTSFLVLLVATLVALLAAEAASGRGRAVLVARRGWIAGVLLVIAGNVAYGTLRLRSPPLVEGPRVAAVQPNAAHVAGGGRASLAQHVNTTLEHVRPGTVDLVAWPENALMDTFPGEADHARLVAVATDYLGADLLLSAFRRHPQRADRVFSSVFQVAPGGAIRTVHDKVLLLPGTEYVPFEDAACRLHPRLGDAVRDGVGLIMRRRPSGIAGARMTVFELATPRGPVRFSTPTCFENVDATLARQGVRGGARFLVNVTSEGTIGPAASRNLLRVAVFRAVENRVSVVRAGNVGISAFVDPLGRVQSTLADASGRTLGARGVLVDRVALWTGAPPPSLVLGEWLPVLALAGLAAALVAARRGRMDRARAVVATAT